MKEKATSQEEDEGRRVEREECSGSLAAWFCHAAGVGTSRRFVMGVTAQDGHGGAF